MLSNKKNLTLNQSNVKQHFSIRKLSIGAASVLLGLTFLGISSNQAQASSTENSAVDSEKINKNNVETQKGTDKGQNKDEVENTANQALIASTKNTTNANDNIVKDGTAITNVPSDSSIKYNFSISAKDKKTGQIEEVVAPKPHHNNEAVLVKGNTENPAVHFELTNISDQDQFIGNSEWGTNKDPNKFNDDEAQLYLNAWSSLDHTLVFNGKEAPILNFVKDGQVIKENALPVYFVKRDNNGNEHWYTYENMLNQFGEGAIKSSRKVGFKGIIPAKTTAELTVPLAFNPNGRSDNEISLLSWDTGSINVTTLQKVWAKDEISNDPIHLVTRNSDGSYTEVPDEAEFSNILPKAGDLVTVTNSNNPLAPNEQVLFVGGNYKISLNEIQNVIKNFGYSVNPQPNNFDQTIQNYYYSTKAGLIVTKNNSSESAIQNNKDRSSMPFFYVEVHKILNTKDSTFEQGSAQASNWTIQDNIESVYNVEKPIKVSNGYAFENVLGDLNNVQIVSLKNKDGNTVSTIDGNTPAGTYTITLGYRLNGSNNKNMFITNTAKIVITPKPVQPTQPTAPSNPTTPLKPTSPVQPTLPSTTDDNNQNVVPKPETPVVPDDQGENTSQNNEEQSNSQTSEENVAPKPEKVNEDKKVSSKSTVKSQLAKVATAHVKSQKLAVSAVNGKSKVANDKQTLPETGEKQNGLAILGLAAVLFATLFGLGAKRRQK